MKIHIEFIGEAEDIRDEAATMAAIKRLLRWGGDEIKAKIHTNPRDKNGWLEWLICIEGSITIGMISREPGAAWEFVS